MPAVSPSHKAIDAYYDALANYCQHGVTHEQAVRLPFAILLETVSKTAGWTLVLEQSLANRKRPDGTLYDGFKIPRGYWEAKDTHDDLSQEIQAKIARGYPLKNTIFEDTRRAVLYQNGRPAFQADLTQRRQLEDLLQRFFAYTGEQIEEFHAAVKEFQDRIPELAEALKERIEAERRGNKAFVAAFEEFHTLCKEALNPAIGTEAIEEMLVQHLLTERLFRTVFDNSDFTRRNVIAAEIEKVIQALTSRSFSRQEFLKKLDYFYLTIEATARTIQDYAEKQGFLNTVYERFFQGFSRQQADTHGIVYTPQAIVDFMCASVEEVLEREFGKSLSSEGVCILDPCVGTGNFIVNLLRRMDRRSLKRKYEGELFCNEIMLLPYYIASLNIEHAYYELTGEYEPFEGICFADTLDLAEARQKGFAIFSEANTERVQRQKDAEITVVIGNPPYRVGQQNENDNNKNRKYPVIDQRIRETYVKDSKARKTKAYNAYSRFFRWATDRLEGRDGIVCFITNNSFVHKDSFDGMRKHFTQDFTQIFHLDLNGSAKDNPKLSGTTHNVFGIPDGVGITLAIRKKCQYDRSLLYYRVPEEWRKEAKLAFLTDKASLADVEWQTLQPNAKHNWLTEGVQAGFGTFLAMGTAEAKAARHWELETIFKAYSLGVSTNRDSVVYAFDRTDLTAYVTAFIQDYNGEVSRWIRGGRPKDIDAFVRYGTLKWSRNLKRELKNERYLEYNETVIRYALYRPFAKRWLYLTDIAVDEAGAIDRFLPISHSERGNELIVVSDHGHRSAFSVLVTNLVPDLHLLASTDGFQCFPFYTYDADGTNRRENITDWALKQFQERYGPKVTKRDIFHYVYGVLHHLGYRERYAENLKRELPRIPLLGDAATFRTLCRIGAELADLHLNYETAEEYPLQWVENRLMPFSWRVTKMRLTPEKDAVIVNDTLTLAGLPPECFEYRLGNRSALEWVIDQYQVRTDARSGITSDPNRADDPEYIARLVGRVVKVSVETVRHVAEISQVPIAADVSAEDDTATTD